MLHDQHFVMPFLFSTIMMNVIGKYLVIGRVFVQYSS